MLKKSLILLLLFSVVVLALPPKIAESIARSGIPKQDISLIIKPVGESTPSFTLNPTQTRKPASVMKLLTLYASLLQFGLEHRWETHFYYRGVIRRGVLHGDLIVKAFGDPTLSSEDLPQIINAIRAKGITHIRGNIIIDRSYFQVGTENSAYFDEYPYSPYNALPDAMMFNERVSVISLDPAHNRASKSFPDSSYRVVNQLTQVSKPCRGRYAWPRVLIDPSLPQPKVYLKGAISKRCSEKKICKVVTKPYLSFYYALKDALQSSGIAFDGSLQLARLPLGAKRFYRHLSKPLAEILAKTAKKSNNLYARHLQLYLGAHYYGAPATLAKGRKAIVQILRKEGIILNDYLKLDNGSGLSRTARLNAQVLARLLDHAFLHYAQRWMDLLSIAGVDGTLKRRFRGVAKHLAWMKTGTLRHVKNIAGYVQGADGRLYTVVIIVNTAKPRSRASNLQNEIIRGIASDPTFLATDDTIAPLSRESTPLPSAPPEATDLYLTGLERFYIQVGTFDDIPPKSYLLRLEALRFSYIVRFAGHYRVLIGPYADRDEALNALNRSKVMVNPDAFLLKEE